MGTSWTTATVETSITDIAVGSTSKTSLPSWRTSNFPDEATSPASSSSMRGLYLPILSSAFDVNHTEPSFKSNWDSGTPWLTSAKVAKSTGGHSAAKTLLVRLKIEGLWVRSVLMAHTPRPARPRRADLHARSPLQYRLGRWAEL